MTSSEVMVSFTGRPRGTCSSLISRCPSGCCDLPHPLLAGHEDFHGALGRLGVADVEARTPDENHGHDERGNRGPQDFQGKRSFNGLGALAGRAAAVLDHEIKNGGENNGGEKHGERGQEKVEIVDRLRDRGSLFGLKWKTLHHNSVLMKAFAAEFAACEATEFRRSRRNITNMKIPRTRRVNAPPARTIFITTMPYLPGFRIVLVAEQHGLVGERADLSAGGVHQAEAEIARGINHAVKIAGHRGHRE